ncbi:alcohol dehydrogenase catalytic domain-containing protein [Subtercola sp. PAMC28395]|uniref:zinc-dependent alcohol dehydrogenase n=1 Tax=Subtercola sp. PAMC28395 TaxID=2846775 RepID=UPI001C0DF728|nr:zinc-binding dehydrogenase [Subtercola sp. PAMC28395]QWT24160.1 alcohol dehydrogenase catalytic domain-containing protein [Subtercola sp. PAMC28395]
MKAAVIRRDSGRKVLVTENLADPQHGEHEVLIRIRASGICGSDLHGFTDSEGTARRDGLIMGHEGAGDVVAVGAGVTRVSVGDRVTIDPQVSCGECVPCSQGLISICDRKRVIGSSLRGFEQGTMAELAAVPEKQVFRVPDSVTFSQASMIEPLSNALHVINRSGILLGDTVVIFGAGTLGLCILQGARLAGAGRIIVSDTSPHRLQVARSLGADVIVNPVEQSVRDEVRALTRSEGADVVIESVGIDATYQEAIHTVRKRGRVMFFGAVQDTVTVDLLPILHKEITIIGCTGANDETQVAIDMVAAGRINLDALLTHQFDLAHAQEAFDTLTNPANNAIKVQVTP